MRSPLAKYLMKLPTADGEIELGEDHIGALVSKYPHTDVRAELGRMLLWLERHPKSRWKLPWRGIERWMKKAEKANVERGAKRLKAVNIEAWWTSNDATIAKATEVGIVPRAGEDWPDLRRRIRERLEKAA